MKYMSVITNFGCHYKCPYCIVKENNLHIPRTTLSGLDNLEEALKENNCDIVSISGGGDPLHEYEKHIDWCQSRERFSAGTSQGSYRGECNQGIYRQSSAHLHESCRHEGA